MIADALNRLIFAITIMGRIDALMAWLLNNGTQILAIVGVYMAMRKKQEEAISLGQENKTTLEVVRKQFDGRLSQLLEKAEMAQRALGITEGQDKERNIQAGNTSVASEAATKVVADALEVAIIKLEDEAEEARQVKAIAAALALNKLKSEQKRSEKDAIK